MKPASNPLYPLVLKRSLSAAAKRFFRTLPLSDGLRYRLRNRVLATHLGERLFSPPPAEPRWPVIDKEQVRAEAEEALTAFLARGEVLALPTSGATPKVSVLVVLFNQAGLSLQCLQALATSRAVDFETIIVDNASSDRVPLLLDRVSGAHILRNEENAGFLLAVNRAAQEARGEYLLLLNNDAMVFPDSLAAAVRRLDSMPQAGAAGGPILLWNGQLQEAGSIIWQDGSCLGYGREADPASFEFGFVRAVDYCSGAFLLIRRALFIALGGFDTDYCPAYYEESDFCVRLWKAGYPVIYDPQLKVRHFEFASTGASTQWAFDLQSRNRLIFRGKHGDFLANQRVPDVASLLLARQRLPAEAQRILFIDDRVPYPSLGAGFPRAQAVVEAIVAAGHFVTHLPLQFPMPAVETEPWPLPETVEVAWGVGHAHLATFLSQRRGFYDVMIVSRPHNADMLNMLFDDHPDLKTGCRVIYDAEALFSLREIAKASVEGKAISPAAQAAMIRDELSLARHADGIMTVSRRECAHFLAAGHGTVHVLGHTIQPRSAVPGFAGRRGFLFVGAIQDDASPNGDSLIWFLQEVWPTISRTLPNAQLDVVGLCQSPTVQALAKHNIHIHGRVPDVQAYYDRARVFIVPTRFAAGIPHKAHEAAAQGLPMVTTPLIAEQLGWQQEIRVGEDAGEFADHCLHLHEDEGLWLALQAALRTAVERDCSPTQFRKAVEFAVCKGIAL
jgi:GT2 family glycosyltransferase